MEFRLNEINSTFAKLQLLGVYYFRHLQSMYFRGEEDNMIRVWTCLRKIKETAKEKLFGIVWWFRIRTVNPSLRPPTSRRFLVFAEFWSKIIFMWEPRPCPLNLYIVLWGHRYYGLRSSRRMLAFLSYPGAMGVLLLSGSPCYFIFSLN